MQHYWKLYITYPLRNLTIPVSDVLFKYNKVQVYLTSKFFTIQWYASANF
jgi:hypothetical protein